MHEPCARFAQTDGAYVNRGGILVLCDTGGTAGMGMGLHEAVTDSDAVVIPATCLLEPSVLSHDQLETSATKRCVFVR